MTDAVFAHTPDQMKQIVRDVLHYARSKGVSDAVAEISEVGGLSVNVRGGEIDTVTRNQDKGLTVTVLNGTAGSYRRGLASTSDFSLLSLNATVDAACNIARYTAEDDCTGLPDAELLETSPRDLKLFYPWDPDPAEAVELAARCEQAAYATDPRITNCDGAGVSVRQGHFIAGNTRGFLSGYAYSRHGFGVSPIADTGAGMQRDGWNSSARDHRKFVSPEVVGRYAAERALSKLNARRLGTRECPVLFEAPVASGLIGSFVQAVSGPALYRKSSFLLDMMGRQIFPDHVDIIEDPHIPGEFGAVPFDQEGVRTVRRKLVSAGRLEGYFLGTYSARKLGMQTTGNGGGAHFLKVESASTAPDNGLIGMLRLMNTGLFVTDLMGQGVNGVTGDYSRGASGFWVENGEIQYPVEEITIAGNLREMFRSIVAIGNDTLKHGPRKHGSILIEKMTVAGNDG